MRTTARWRFVVTPYERLASIELGEVLRIYCSWTVWKVLSVYQHTTNWEDVNFHKSSPNSHSHCLNSHPQCPNSRLVPVSRMCIGVVRMWICASVWNPHPVNPLTILNRNSPFLVTGDVVSVLVSAKFSQNLPSCTCDFFWLFKPVYITNDAMATSKEGLVFIEDSCCLPRSRA